MRGYRTSLTSRLGRGSSTAFASIPTRRIVGNASFVLDALEQALHDRRPVRLHHSGGFDERYVGYGGEDTDFAKTLAMAGVPLAWVKGAARFRAYHQYHPHHMPPIHHLESVVRNSELFETKWGYRTMGHWLYAFRLMGLIDDRPGRPIRILRRPGEADLALTGQQSHQPYANTATVIRRLEAEAEPNNEATA